MTEQITLFARIEVAPEFAANLKAAIAVMAAGTRAEAGCLLYALHAAQDNPACVMIHEVWRDEAALGFHRTTPHMAEFKAAIAPWSPVLKVERFRAYDL